MRPTRFAVLALLAAGTLRGGALAAPTDDQVKAANDAFRAKAQELSKANQATDDTLRAAALDAIKGLPIEELTAEQIDMLASALSNADDRTKAAAIARLETFANANDLSGLNAATLILSFMDEDKTPAREQAAALSRALRHPALHAALKEAKGLDVFMQAAGASKEAIRMAAPDLKALEASLTPDLPGRVALMGTGLFRALVNMGEEGAALRESFRGRFLAIAKNAGATAPEDQKARYASAAQFFDGAFAKGTLIGAPAPQLSIAWSSDPTIKSLADLKGKVVVIDFWATWCGPCIRSFPNIREMLARYEGYPVAVVGVTSAQGYVISRDGRVDTKGTPDKEYAMMPAVMEWRGMTWPVVFTEQNVFNPDFGVVGIPHVAILDPSGKVRYNGLHPARPLEEKAEKIDALLREAGLATPPKI